MDILGASFQKFERGQKGDSSIALLTHSLSYVVSVELLESLKISGFLSIT